MAIWLKQGLGLGLPFVVVGPDISFLNKQLCTKYHKVETSIDLESDRPNHGPAIPGLCDLGI